jgi:hypothetical protein
MNGRCNVVPVLDDQASNRNAEDAIDFDPTLLNSAVAQCEKLLEALKKSIIARTHDKAFADLMLDKIRRASKRGTAVALLRFLIARKSRSPLQVRIPGCSIKSIPRSDPLRQAAAEACWTRSIRMSEESKRSKENPDPG